MDYCPVEIFVLVFSKLSPTDIVRVRAVRVIGYASGPKATECKNHS